MDYIKIEQLPKITERLKELSDTIEERINKAISINCTDENIKEVKKIRTELNKESEEMEYRRKEVKKAILEPYNAFEDSYKYFIGDKYKAADKALKSKISLIEYEKIKTKRESVKSYFNELCQSLEIDFLSFDKWSPNINLSTTERSLKTCAKSFIEDVAEQLRIIRGNTTDALELEVEYKRCLDLKTALDEVSKRKKEIAKITSKAEDIEENNSNILSPPQEVIKVTFEVTGGSEDIKSLSKLMREIGLKGIILKVEKENI